MYRISKKYRTPKLKDIKLENIFADQHYPTNAYIDQHDIFLKLPDVKKIDKNIKNESDAGESPVIIRLRPSIKMSSGYRLPSIYILKSDANACKKLIRQDFIAPKLGEVSKSVYQRVAKIYDALKDAGVDYAPIKDIITEFVLVFKSKHRYDHWTFLSITKEVVTELSGMSYSEGAAMLLNLYDRTYGKDNPDIQGEMRQLEQKNKEHQQKEEAERRQMEHEAKIERKRQNEEIDRRFMELLTKSRDKVAACEYIQEHCDLSAFTEPSRADIFSTAKSALISFNLHIKKNKRRVARMEGFDLYESLISYLLPEEYIKYVNHIFATYGVQIKYMPVITDVKDPRTYTFNDKKLKDNNETLIQSLIDQMGAMSGVGIWTYPLFKSDNGDYAQQLSLLLYESDHHSKITRGMIRTAYEYDMDHLLNSFDKNKLQASLEQMLDEHVSTIIKSSSLPKSDELTNDLKECFQVGGIVHLEYDTADEVGELIKNKDNTTVFAKRAFELITDNPRTKEQVSSTLLKHSKLFQSYKGMFPKARNRGRKITFLHGETNSGKTYAAFEELKQYNSGVYLAPLRLLAFEGQEEIENRGKKCNLLTGEERIYRESATFSSSTVEMLNTNEEYDVAIIDEVQLVADRYRGKSWFRAIAGVNAKHLILVGSTDILGEIIKIADYLGEDLTIKEFAKKVKLSTLDKPFDINKKLEPNTAVIGFSKRDLISLKRHYEELGNQVSVIYGKLPPEIKHQESKRFRNGETDVLVSTDAIGMGLNLPVKTIVFSGSTKFNGKNVAPIEPALVKQIAGRAGRYNLFDEGFVTSYNNDDLDYIRDAQEQNTTIQMDSYFVPISIEIYQEIKRIFNTAKVLEIINYYHRLQFDFSIKSSEYEYTTDIAYTLDEDQLKAQEVLKDQEIVKLLNAPVSGDKNDRYLLVFSYMVRRLIQARKRGQPLDVNSFHNFYKRVQANYKFANNEEQRYKIIDIFNFFVLNFTEFQSFEKPIKKEKARIVKAIDQNLKGNVVEREISRHCEYY